MVNILDLKYISQYLPNNKCDANVDHHDHENEKEHLHRHSNRKRRVKLNRPQDLSASEPNLKIPHNTPKQFTSN